MKNILLLTESLEPGNFHTGIYNGLISNKNNHVIPILIPRNVNFNFSVYDEIIKNAIDQFKIDILFSIQAEAVNINTIKYANNKNVKTIIWQVDDPYILDYAYNKKEHIDKLKEYNIIYSTNKESINNQYKNLNLNVEFLPFGYDKKFHNNLNLEKKYDVSFVGSAFNTRKNNYIKYIHNDIDLFGCNDNLWKHKGRISYLEMINILNQTKINLNFSDQPVNNIYCLKNRVTETLGCGQFLLTENFPELNEMFSIGKDLDSFSSLDELKSKIEFYLKNDSIREKIAKNGYNTIQKYSYSNLCKEIIG